MERAVNKYADKLVSCGLCAPGTVLLGGLDAEITWNRRDDDCRILEAVVGGLNINTILLARPTGAMGGILDFLAATEGREEGAIFPEDCETRTFLHDIPVAPEFAAAPIIAALKKRKSVLVRNKGIVTFGVVSPEQAFVHFSSVCFASFVRFFGNYYKAVKGAGATQKQQEIFRIAVAEYEELLGRAAAHPPLQAGPFTEKEAVLAAICEAGKATVDCGMVDSFFGNASYRLDDTIFITQTASSLDELAGCIDACPLDGSSCVGITASSEFTAHREVLATTEKRTILHGHPRFSVIYSMICEREDCALRGECHRHCDQDRRARGVPIAPGEAGTGPLGLATTLPPALKDNPGAIIYGHGVFTAGAVDFTAAFKDLVEIETWCFREYLKLVGAV